MGRENLAGQTSLPDVTMLAWNISSRCNLSCKHCYLGEIRESQEITQSELEKIVKQVSEQKIKAVFLAGGEPLLIQNLESVIEQFSLLKISVYVNTNAILLDEKRINSLLNSGLKGFIIGFDGITQETFDYIRGKNAYYRVLTGLKLAIQKGCHVEVDFTLNAINGAELITLPEWGDALGISRITIKRYVPRLGSEFDNQLRLRPEYLKTVYYNFLNKYPYPSQRDNCKIFAHDPMFLVAKDEKGLLLDEDILREDCNAGGYYRGWIGLSSEGSIQACPVITEIIFGNILTDELRDVINSNKMKELRDKISPVCQNCQSQSYCRGGCRATKIRLGIKLDQPDPCCWKIHGYKEK